MSLHWLAEAAAFVGAALLSCVFLTWSGIRYARSRRMIDWPGQRRSHVIPTPRGGGIGMAAAVFASIGLAACCLPSLALPPQIAPSLLAAVGVVGAIGWVDDHGGVSARWRILVHGMAAALVVASIAPMIFAQWALAPMAQLGLAGCLWLAVVWSINLHNFMDGINGLLAAQAVFVFVVLALVLHFAAAPRITQLWLWLFAVVAAGFLPFNFPRARIFMGDVGSGVLGLLIAVAVLWQMGTPGVAASTGFVVVSGLVVDATCTLLSRLLRGRRWYSAHREHLYQWLVRCGYSHAQVVALYMVWNVLIVLPVVYWLNRGPVARAAPAGALALVCAVYALAIALWWFGKRACLRVACSRRAHAVA